MELKLQKEKEEEEKRKKEENDRKWKENLDRQEEERKKQREDWDMQEEEWKKQREKWEEQDKLFREYRDRDTDCRTHIDVTDNWNSYTSSSDYSWTKDSSIRKSPSCTWSGYRIFRIPKRVTTWLFNRRKYMHYVDSDKLADIIMGGGILNGLFAACCILAVIFAMLVIGAEYSALLMRVPEDTVAYTILSLSIISGAAAMAIILASLFGWKATIITAIPFFLVRILLFIDESKFVLIIRISIELLFVICTLVGFIPGMISFFIIKYFIEAATIASWFLAIIPGILFGLLLKHLLF